MAGDEDNNWKTRIIDARERVTGFIVRGKKTLQEGNLGDKLRNLDPAQISEWVGSRLQSQGVSFYGKAATIILCAFFLSDLTALLAGKYIPEPPPSASRFMVSSRRIHTVEEYQPIFARNLFNSKGIIPGEDTGAPGAPIDLGGAPIKSTLPLNLIGTMILEDEMKSIATIEDKTASQVYPVRISDEIPQKAKIVQIEPRRVIFVNVQSGRKEYIDLPEEAESDNPKITLGTKTAGPGIERVSPTQFNISRSEVDKALSDLNNILTQARAVPHFENGQPAGYKLFQIVPGSIYDKLGLQNGDVIAGFDGNPINDPGKAFQALSGLRDTPHLEIQVVRNGTPTTFSYDIH